MNVVHLFPTPRVRNCFSFFLCCLCKLDLEKAVVQLHNWTIRLEKGELQHCQCDDLTQAFNFPCDECDRDALVFFCFYVKFTLWSAHSGHAPKLHCIASASFCSTKGGFDRSLFIVVGQCFISAPVFLITLDCINICKLFFLLLLF